MIINTRGTNGAGKTTTWRKMIDTYGVEEAIPINLYTGRDRKPAIYVLKGDLYVVGRYMIGADAIPHPLLCDLVEQLSQIGHVAYENILVSGSARRWSELADRCCGETVFALLDTPIELCLERVQIRNGGKDVKENLIEYQWKRSHATTKQLAEEFGQKTVMLDHTRSFEQVQEILRSGGWDPS